MKLAEFLPNKSPGKTMANAIAECQQASHASKTRRCTTCQRVLPITEFRRRYANTEDRQTQCNRCRNAFRREKTRNKREQRVHDFTQETNRKTEDPAGIIAVTEEMIRYFKGVDRFVATWQDSLERAEAAKKHYLVSRSMLAIVNLIAACTEMDERRPQPAELDDEDLSRQLDIGVLQMIASYPELAIRAANQLGWTIIPPNDCNKTGAYDDQGRQSGPDC